jgi:hypothetical protein
MSIIVFGLAFGKDYSNPLLSRPLHLSVCLSVNFSHSNFSTIFSLGKFAEKVRGCRINQMIDPLEEPG